MENFLIISAFLILLFFFLRERCFRKIFQKGNNYFEDERKSLWLKIQKQNEKIFNLKKENIALKKKDREFFFEKIGYNRILRRHKRRVYSLSKKNEVLKYNLHNYEKLEDHYRDKYLYNKE